MKEKLAKKLGELLAFSQVGHDLFERTRENMLEVWPADELSLTTEENLGFAEQIKILTDKEKVSEITLAKAERTKEKLMKMQELYLGTDTDPVEILEWLSFFEGAAAAHASLVAGMAGEMKDVLDLAQEINAFHRKLSEKVSASLFEAGKKS